MSLTHFSFYLVALGGQTQPHQVYVLVVLGHEALVEAVVVLGQAFDLLALPLDCFHQGFHGLGDHSEVIIKVLDSVGCARLHC
jgi:hypothetical protein